MKHIFTYLFFLFIYYSATSQNISGIVNTYRKVLWADSATGRLKLSDVTGFASYTGYKAFIMQMKGATMDETASSSFGNINAINEAGYYEVGTICGFLNDTVVMERKLNNLYNVNGIVQFVIIPKYTNATVVDTLKAMNWNDSTGGIVAIEVTGTLTLNKPISASGAGFKGGVWNQFGPTCRTNIAGGPITDYWLPYLANDNKTAGKKGEGIAAYISGKEYAQGKQLNGGGGGNNLNAGGGGGANYAAGGNGGNRVNGGFAVCQSNGGGRGGLALNSVGYSLSPLSQNRIFLGGGGGAGHDDNSLGMPGGAGGGIVLVIANTIIAASGTPADNMIIANGESGMRFLSAPYNIYTKNAASDGSGGGGGGGVVILKTTNYTGSLALEAKGADGGGTETGGQNQCNGPGGGGGGGVVWLSQSSTPAGVTTTVTGGANGTTSATASCPNSANGATAGANGALLLNFAFATPKDSSTICKGLVPIKFIISLSGNKTNFGNYIHTSVTNQTSISSVTLQSSFNGVDFTDIKTWSNNTGNYDFVDATTFSKMYYRIKVFSVSGSVSYSSVLLLASQNASALQAQVYPNPTHNFLGLQVTATQSSNATVKVFNTSGKLLMAFNSFLNKGINTINTPLSFLDAGVFYLEVFTNKEKVILPFTRLL